ncbi:peptidoglycan recognition protein family protein [Enterococcus asini]|uniref:peptidoglycan recognition protein family protein n=1 Tax=Enterococcus asini TaxID=57732 RepID=UPI00090049E3|nr:N-acetylmuramoyl-L-alanine amidase [Enterococcus asini]OJG13008.1 N-acetylmuramoyl-L-alanine amidase [Enterococcus asini]
MSFIKYEYIGINKYSRPGIKNNGIKGLIMHYTANNGGTARNHKSYFNNLSGSYASAQLFVDDVEALCIIPLDEVAYHANDIQKYVNGQPYYPLRGIIGNANYSTIGLEMCLDAHGNITEKTFQNAVKAVKELIKMYPQITADRIWRHYDVTGKNCPAPWVAKPSELDRFKKAVFGASTPSKPSAPSKPKPNKPWKDVVEDGMWGNDLTRVLQQVYGSGTADGVISGQIKSSANQNVYAAKWGKGGSNLIRVFQMRLKAKGWYNGAIDGNLGPGTVKALQRAFGTTQDGVISPKSNMVKAIQKALNQNKLPF